MYVGAFTIFKNKKKTNWKKIGFLFAKKNRFQIESRQF